MENVQLNWKAKAACNENFVVMQTTGKKNFLKIIKISEVQKEFPPTEPPHALFNSIAALIAIVAVAKYYAYAALTQLAASQIQYFPTTPPPSSSSSFSDSFYAHTIHK